MTPRDWRDMRPEDFDVEATSGPDVTTDEGLFPLPVHLTRPPVDPCGTGDLLAEILDP